MSLSVGLFTYSTLPRGSVVHTAQLADALCDAGVDVTVYALDKDGRGFFRPLRAALRLVAAGPTPPTTAELVRRRGAELRAHLVAARPRHDLFHAEDCLTASALLGDGRRVVRTVHHVERFADPFLAACQERSIREAALCLAVSAAAARDVRETFGVDCARVSNGVDVARFAGVEAARAAEWRRRLRPGDAGPVLLVVGGVEERKNTLGALRAFARVRRSHPRARLVIVGGASALDHGAYRAGFAAALAALGEAARDVVELGVVADADMPALYHAADVLLFVSLHEGFGLAALEALAAGLPVVAADRAPMTEFLDASCAVLVDPLAAESMAGGVVRALVAPASRRAAGLRRALAFSWQRVAALHIAHYLRALGGPMPEMHFTVRWPDGHHERCYSPSLVVHDFLEIGKAYAVGEFVDRSRTMLHHASERVRQRYGFACSAALDQLAAIEARAAGFAADSPVTVLAFEP